MGLQLRLYSRELGLNAESLLYVQQLPSAAVVLSMTGQDSLLVYTYDNVLHHYIINASDSEVTLTQKGQIALHGIVRAPARVRAVTWIIPDFQLRKSSFAGFQDMAETGQGMVTLHKMLRMPQSYSLSTQSSCCYNRR